MSAGEMNDGRAGEPTKRGLWSKAMTAIRETREDIPRASFVVLLIGLLARELTTAAWGSLERESQETSSLESLYEHPEAHILWVLFRLLFPIGALYFLTTKRPDRPDSYRRSLHIVLAGVLLLPRLLGLAAGNHVGPSLSWVIPPYSQQLALLLHDLILVVAARFIVPIRQQAIERRRSGLIEQGPVYWALFVALVCEVAVLARELAQPDRGDLLASSYTVIVLLLLLGCVLLRIAPWVAQRLREPDPDGGKTASLRTIERLAFLLLFPVLMIAFTYGILRLEAMLPGNPSPGRSETMAMLAPIGLAWTLATPFVVAYILLCARSIYVGSGQSSESTDTRLSLAAYVNAERTRQLPVPVIGGTILNVVLSIAPTVFLLGRFGHPSEGTIWVIIQFWIISAIAWLAPYIQTFQRYADSARQATISRCEDVLRSSRRHTVIAGFGDMGKRLAARLYDGRELSTVMLADCKVATIWRSLVVIDHDKSRFSLLDEGCMPPIGLVEIELDPSIRTESQGGSTSPDGDGDAGRDRIFAVGICGDSRHELTQNCARIEQASLVVSLIRQSDTVTEFIGRHAKTGRRRGQQTEREVPAVLGVNSSADIAYSAGTTLEHPIQLFFPRQLRAFAVARVVLAAIYARRALQDPLPRVALVGRGKDLGYILDSICKGLDRSDIVRLKSPDQKKITTFSMISNDSIYVDRLETRVAPVLDGLRVESHRVEFGLFYEKDFTREDGTVGDRFIPIDVINSDLNRTATLEHIFSEVAPDIVVLSEMIAHDQIVELRNVVRALKATKGIRLPLLIAAAETGRRGRAKNIGDVLDYYASVRAQRDEEDHAGKDAAPRAAFPDGPYPRQVARPVDHGMSRILGDSAVDVVDDPIHRVAAMIEARQEAERAGDGQGLVQLELCTTNDPGSFATVLANLAGMRLVPRSKTDSGYEPLSLMDTRIMEVGGHPLETQKKCVIDAFVAMKPAGEDQPTAQPERTEEASSSSGKKAPCDLPPAPLKRMAVLPMARERSEERQKSQDGSGREPTPTDQEPSGSTPKKKEEAPGVAATIRALAEPAAGSWSRSENPIEALCQGCPDMTSCIVVRMRRRAEAEIVRGKSELDHLLVSSEIPGSTATAESDGTPAQEKSSGAPAIARLVSIFSTEGPGTLAAHLARLAHCRLEPEAATPPRQVLDISYLSDNRCSNDLYSAGTIYGRIRPLEGLPKNQRTTAAGARPSWIVLRPMSLSSRWAHWAGLFKVGLGLDGGKYSLGILSRDPNGVLAFFEDYEVLPSDHQVLLILIEDCATKSANPASYVELIKDGLVGKKSWFRLLEDRREQVRDMGECRVIDELHTALVGLRSMAAPQAGRSSPSMSTSMPRPKDEDQDGAELETAN
ncbi:MAG: hypothetical protein H6807_16100 [Planctomycetes bacterium]|nr:hypothetical protein [Planctomycetota bacterium]